MRFLIHTLGCPKNEVDSEGMEATLVEAGHRPVTGLADADLVIVNTCGFIESAKKESLGALKEMSAGRAKGALFIAAGCLAQREGEALIRRVAGVDAVLGCRNWPEVARLVDRLASTAGNNGIHPPIVAGDRLQLGSTGRTARGSSAYVKISDGCDAACAFCAIPAIKGRHQSKPKQQVLSEIQQLVEGGAQEIVLVGQDTTSFGLDRGETDGLAHLLEDILDAEPDLRWLRVLYMYPHRITLRLLKLLAGAPQMCKYIDIPLQHTHAAMLRRMNRPPVEVARQVDTLRNLIPEVAIRTTFIVGFPGETEEEHSHLLRSIEEMKFDRVGVFQFSPQGGTAAAGMPGQIGDRAKKRRWSQAMETAQKVSLKQNRHQVGRALEVLVEGAEAGTGERAPMMAGRSYRDAPEVDGLVLFTGKAEVGQFVKVRIISALEYDLVGEAV